MRCRSLALSLFSSFLLAAVPFKVWAAPVTCNPHTSADRESCLSCHTVIPVADDAACGVFRLTRDTVDETCRCCHRQVVCALGPDRVEHLSDAETWNCQGPKTLPLNDGRITCTTCHYRMKPEGGDYKMVRNVALVDGKPDFTKFCADCHPGR
jgi:hypothetical protein